MWCDFTGTLPGEQNHLQRHALDQTGVIERRPEFR